MQLTLIDKDMLRTAIACNTDANEQDAASIINAVLMAQRRRHGAKCDADPFAKDVCEGMYDEKCDDVIGLCDALRAVLAIAGEDSNVRTIVENAINEHGLPGAQRQQSGAAVGGPLDCTVGPVETEGI